MSEPILIKGQIQAEYDRERRKSNRKLINDIKLQKRCLYCKGIEKLEFHHRDPNEKFIPVSNMASYTTKRILEEIEKCDVVCNDCHRNLHRFGRIIYVTIPIYIPIPIKVDTECLV